jgi:hypothetical protein
MAPKPSHVPKLIIEAGGLDMVFSPACKKALLACGINPNSFDSYKRRKAAEKRAKAQLKSQAGSHTTEKALKKDPEKFLEANSQSGHMAQNAFFQGKRDSPCTNVPPDNASPGEATDGGGYGYQMDTAPCTDHYGKSTQPGTVHYDITQLECKRATELRQLAKKNPDLRLDQADLKETVREAAKKAAKGPDAPETGGATAKRVAKAQASQAAKGKDPKKPAGKGPDAKTIDKAADCMADAWEEAINKQREECIARYSTDAKIERENPGASKKAKQQMAKDRKAELAKEQNSDDFKKKVKKKDASLDDKAQAERCLEHQANWLKAYKEKNGELPPVAGRVPGPEGGRTKDTDTASTREKP